MTAAWAVAAAAIFVWLGMVVAISFLEAPLKFRAPGVTLRIGLGIGRLVFRALNAAELMLALMVLVALSFQPPPWPIVVGVAIAVATLAVQLLVVRRWLNRRSDAVLAGAEPQRSRSHHAYVGLELLKAVSLLVSGVLLLNG